jgi:hypothetical protein
MLTRQRLTGTLRQTVFATLTDASVRTKTCRSFYCSIFVEVWITGTLGLQMA